MNSALLAVRLIVGLGLAAHGAQKLFGWFGGYGLKGTGGWLESLGFRPGQTFALLAGLGEFVGGSLVALGLGGPIGPGLMISVLVVAILTVHIKNGFFVTANGFELPLLYISIGVLFAMIGYGAYSLDRAFGLMGLTTVRHARIAIAAGMVAGLLAVSARRAPPAQPPA